MHPSLALSKLSELPLQLKKLAKAAAAGSLQDLLVIIPLRATMLPKTHSLLLPVYYALLDPKDITPLRDPDRLHTDDATERVRLVVLALACLDEAVCCKDVVPEAVRPDLWDRAWLWIQFLVEFDMSPAVWPSRGTPQEVYARILYACAGEHTFDSVQSTPAAVLLTPGLYILITYLWRHLLECKSSSDSEDPVGWVTSFLTRAALRTPAIVDDLLEGAGSWDSVAQLIITQLRRAFPSSQDPLTYKATLLLDGVDSFLVFAYADGESPLREALFQQGVVPLLTTACLVLSKQLVPPRPSLAHRENFVVPRD
ncbi:hypothetical protein C8F01DRAFT_1368332 [Mycena amicta]|nr:hypothetical protein C8F01DRAFT_1368332 [Mycena amicta]